MEITKNLLFFLNKPLARLLHKLASLISLYQKELEVIFISKKSYAKSTRRQYGPHSSSPWLGKSEKGDICLFRT